MGNKKAALYMENRYEVIRTNQRLNAENVWRLYNQCAVVERVIDGLKNDLSATGIRAGRFWPKHALCIIGLIAFNLPNSICRIAPPRACRAARIKRLSFLFFQVGASVVCRSRGLWSKIDKHYPLRLIFYRAFAVLKAA